MKKSRRDRNTFKGVFVFKDNVTRVYNVSRLIVKPFAIENCGLI